MNHNDILIDEHAVKALLEDASSYSQEEFGIGELLLDESAHIGITPVRNRTVGILTKLDLSRLVSDNSKNIRVVMVELPTETGIEEYFLVKLSDLHVSSAESKQLTAGVLNVLIRNIYAGAGPAVRTIETMREMFSGGFPRGDVSYEKQLGFFGELVFIDTFSDKDALIEAWHPNPNDAFDFVYGNKNIEVKTTMKDQRKHSFSNAQLYSNPDRPVYVASILLSKAGVEGKKQTIRELFESILKQTQKVDNREKLRQMVVDTFDMSAEELPATEFVRSEESVLIFEGIDIPQFHTIHPHIVSVRWEAKLGGIEGSHPTEEWLKSC